MQSESSKSTDSNRRVLDYQNGMIYVKRWVIIVVGCLMLIESAALIYLSVFRQSRWTDKLPQGALNELRAFEAYKHASDRAIGMIPQDRVEARKILEATIAKARQQSVLPLKMPWPSSGEEALLRLYLSDDSVGATPQQKEQFIAYIRQSYPSYDFETMRKFESLQSRIRHRTRNDTK